MEKRLNESNNKEIYTELEINEHTTSLNEGIKFNLEGAMMRCFDWTPLRVAASQGHEQLEIFLRANSEFAEALYSQTPSLLHLASANGDIKIVEALTKVRPEMCLARDRDGLIPLHVAAMRGKVEVLDALLKGNRHGARARVDNGERDSILHICVKYDQVEFLKILLKYFPGEEFVNAKDNEGNTILHLAVADQRLEIVNYLLSSTRININKLNANKQTAMDILLLQERGGSKLDEEDHRIHALLKSLGGKKNSQILFDPARDSDRRNGVMVSAALFATLAFQVGAAPPGGVWQDDDQGHKSGKAVMASHYPTLYQVFLCCNVVSFTSSFLTIALMWLNLFYKVKAYILMVSVTMSVSILFIAATYGISLYVVSRPEQLLAKVNLLVEIFIPFILTVAFFPLVYWILRCWERKRVTNRPGVKGESRAEAGPADRILVAGTEAGLGHLAKIGYEGFGLLESGFSINRPGVKGKSRAAEAGADRIRAPGTEDVLAKMGSTIRIG